MKTLVRVTVATMLLGASFSVASWTQDKPLQSNQLKPVHSEGSAPIPICPQYCGGNPK